jgi:hypothetical protein
MDVRPISSNLPNLTNSFSAPVGATASSPVGQDQQQAGPASFSNQLIKTLTADSQLQYDLILSSSTRIKGAIDVHVGDNGVSANNIVNDKPFTQVTSADVNSRVAPHLQIKLDDSVQLGNALQTGNIVSTLA